MMLDGLLHSEDDQPRGIPVIRLQTAALAGDAIDAIECRAALAPVDQTESIFHRLSCASLLEKKSELLRCYGRVRLRSHDFSSVEKLVPVLVPVPAPSCGKTLTHKRFSLEARVGIEQIWCFGGTNQFNCNCHKHRPIA
jgi:hypothetical protein